MYILIFAMRNYRKLNNVIKKHGIQKEIILQ